MYVQLLNLVYQMMMRISPNGKTAKKFKKNFMQITDRYLFQETYAYHIGEDLHVLRSWTAPGYWIGLYEGAKWMGYYQCMCKECVSQEMIDKIIQTAKKIGVK